MNVKSEVRSLIAFEQLAFNAQKYRGTLPLVRPLFENFKFFKGSCPNCPSLPAKSVSLTILEQLAFNPQQFRRPCVPGHAVFSENFKGVMFGVSLGTCVSSLNSITLTVLEQLTFNAKTYRGNVTLGTPLLKNF